MSALEDLLLRTYQIQEQERPAESDEDATSTPPHETESKVAESTGCESAEPTTAKVELTSSDEVDIFASAPKLYAAMDGGFETVVIKQDEPEAVAAEEPSTVPSLQAVAAPTLPTDVELQDTDEEAAELASEATPEVDETVEITAGAGRSDVEPEANEDPAPQISETQTSIAESPVSQAESTDTIDKTELEGIQTSEVAPIAIKMFDDFKPDWEVDRFLWPDICIEVETRLERELELAVERIQERCHGCGTNIVAVTHETPGAGATTMTLCLAREAARQGLKVAVIDLNHSDPTVMERLGVAFEEGVESLAQANVTAESISVTAIEDEISLLPTTQPIDLEYSVGPVVHQMLEIVSKHHDIVLMDTSQEVARYLAEHQPFGATTTIVVQSNSEKTLPSVFTDSDRTLGIIENFAA